jgi:hypothetical protein
LSSTSKINLLWWYLPFGDTWTLKGIPCSSLETFVIHPLEGFLSCTISLRICHDRHSITNTLQIIPLDIVQMKFSSQSGPVFKHRTEIRELPLISHGVP